ncbi:MAG: hypothetical protein QW035_01795 [Candidatus Anstonellales archaeon]
MKIPGSICVICKGTKHLCGAQACPILARIRTQLRAEFKKEEQLTAGNFLVTENLALGPISGPYSLPSLFGKEYSEVVSALSSSLFAKSFSMRSELEEIALSSKPIDISVEFTRKPEPRPKFSPFISPIGASAPIKTIELESNPSIPPIVDEVMEDRLLAKEAIFEIERKEKDIYYLSRVLSSGLLGKSPRLVPTRNSITAVDSILSKRNIEKIKEFPQASSYSIAFSSFLHNTFTIILLPTPWQFENFEAYIPGSLWVPSSTSPVITEEYEPYQGRGTYADKQAGGYYAVRFAVTEYLLKEGRQAGVVVIREVGEAYKVPVGVWQVRENARNALKKVLSFLTLSEALEEAKKRLSLPINEYIKRSRVLYQKRLF